MDNMIPLSVPNFEGREEEYVMDAVRQGWVSTAGAYVVEFEKMLSAYLGVTDAAVCQSGTAALHLSMIESGVKAGDMVIVPTLTFIAAVNPVRYLGADPVFMDCDDSLCIDPCKLEEFCKQECVLEQDTLIYRKTGQIIRTMVVVHVFGNMADMETIMEIAQNYHIGVIEDATEALGTKYVTGRYAGKMAGTIGDFGAYSFNGNKIITTGGGGAVVARQKSKLIHIRYLSTQAKDDSMFYIHNEVGYNYRMTNIQAALGLAQLEKLPDFIERKQKNYRLYEQMISENRLGKLMPFRDETAANYWFYALKLKEKFCGSVRKMVQILQEDYGIQTRPIWGLIHKQPPYEKDMSYRIEKAEYYAGSIINIPCSTNLQPEEIRKVVEGLKGCILDR